MQFQSLLSVRHFSIKMGKKSRNTTEPNPGMVPSRDVMNRLNFLYQASILFASATAHGSTSGARKGKRRALDQHTGEMEARKGEGATGTEKGYLIPTQTGRESLASTSTREECPSVVDPAVEVSGGGTTKKRKSNHEDPSALPALSRMMVQTLKDVSTKGTIRM